MYSKNWSAAIAALLLIGAGTAAPAPIEVYGRLPTLSNVKLSPDGNTLAYIRGTEAKRAIVIQPIGTANPPVILNVTGQKVRSLEWADSSHLIFLISSTEVPMRMEGERGEWSTAQYFDLRTKTTHPLLKYIKGLDSGVGAMNIVAGLPLPRVVDGHPVVFVPGFYYPDPHGMLGLFREDLDSGESHLVSPKGRPDADDWLLDEAGNILAEEDLTRYTQHWKLVLYRDGLPDKTVLDIPAPIEGPGMVGLTQDGSAIVVQMAPTEEGVFFEQVSLKDGTITPWRSDLPQSIDVMVDSETGRVVGAEHNVERTDYIFFDPQLEALWKSVNAAFAGATNVALVSWSDDKTKAVAEVFGEQFGNGYFLVDMTAKKAMPLGSAYDGITEFYPEKWIDYQAGDGRVIHAYLTTPLHRDLKNLPLIVLPHGGPHARDYPGFDWISQSLASLGYVVLQPEFRGSGGFGRELLTAGFGEFGKKMQTDLSDGVRTLAAQGMIDPKRVCIVGASYGGYAALAGATLDTGVYRCAVSIAGLSDMADMMKEWPRPAMGANGMRFWDRFLGVTGKNFSKLADISPIKHIDKVNIPILLIHGRDDTVVAYSQSENMADALKAAGKPYQFVTLDHEDHWLSHSETRLQMLEATVKFLEANNPPN